MKALQPQRVPQPQMVVAVQSFPPSYRLVYLADVDETEAGTELPIFGWNNRTRRIYVPGDLPPDFRQTEEDGDYENEFWVERPVRMAEVDLNEYPANTFKIITPDAREEELPRFEKKKRGCKIIKHWATVDKEHREAQEAARFTIQPDPEPVLEAKGQWRLPIYQEDFQPQKSA